MPLGKLSKNQIIAGYNILSEVQALIDSGSIDKIKFIDATNRSFFFEFLIIYLGNCATFSSEVLNMSEGEIKENNKEKYLNNI